MPAHTAVPDRFAKADSRAFAGTAACKEGAGARAGADGGSGPAFRGSGSGCCHHSPRSNRGGHWEDDAYCGTVRYDGGHHGQSLAEPFGFQPDG